MSGDMNQQLKRRKGSDSSSLSENSPKRLKSDDENLRQKTPETDCNNSHKKTYRKGGLVRSLHGVIYQLKLQMLFLKRALDEDYEFNLGTEVEDAAKFDDIVFKYKDTENKIRFVQAKHKQDGSKKITANDLLAEKNNDFSLQKYFISYREINKNNEYSTAQKDFTIYTNIDFDYGSLEGSNIAIELIQEHDAILNITKSEKSGIRRKLIPNGHKLFEKLRKTSDVYLLADQLAKYFDSDTPIVLGSDVLRLYHAALSNKVFEEKNNEKKFCIDFVNGDKLSEDVRNFRDVLKSVLKNENDDSAFKELLKKQAFSVASTFGHVFELQSNPSINKPKELAKKFADIIINSKVKGETTSTFRKSGVIKDNIGKLAGHVLVQVREQNPEDRNRFKFSKLFLDDHDSKLPGNIKEFKDEFIKITKNKINYDELEDLEFKISKFKTCYETNEGKLLLPENALPTDKIEDCEIEDFFRELVFAVDQPNEVDLGDIIIDDLKESYQFSLLSADLVAASFQEEMLNWFKHQRGVWLDKEKGTNFFGKIEKKIKRLISVGLNLACREKLGGYGVEFDKNKISRIYEKFEAFIPPENTSTNILHIKTQETTVFSSIKVCQILEEMKKSEALSKYTKDGSHIFMSLGNLLMPKIQKRVVEDLKSCYYIVIYCEPTATKNEIIGVCDELKLTEKKIILITKIDDALALALTEKFVSVDECQDTSLFGDLIEESKRTLLDKEILFTGDDTSLKNLYCELGDSNSDPSVEQLHQLNFDIEPLGPLLENPKVEVGYKPPRTSDLEGAYSDLCEEVNKKALAEKLSLQSHDIYIISGIPDSNKANGLIKYLGNNIVESEDSIRSQIAIFNKETTNITGMRIQLADDKFEKNVFQRSGFKQVCKYNSEQNIYWIHLQNDKDDETKCDKSAFKLEKVYDPNFYVACERFTNEVILEKSIKDLFVSDQLSEKFVIIIENADDFKTWLGIGKDKKDEEDEEDEEDGEDQEDEADEADEEDEEDEKKQFDKNCDDKKITLVHAQDKEKNFQESTILEFKQQELVLLQPTDSVDHLVKYRAKGCKRICEPLIGEDNLIQEIMNTKTVIIAGDPGIGKSTTLVKLYESKYKTQSQQQQLILKSNWVIKINLKDRSTLETIRDIDFSNSNIKAEKIKEFLSKVDETLKAGVAKSLLAAAFKPNFGRPLLLAFDGFDEISDELDRKKIILLLRNLQNEGIRFWITTRFHYEKKLEAELSTFATRLGSMDDPAICDFIKKFFSNRLNFCEKKITEIIESAEIKKYTKGFVKKMKQVFTNNLSVCIGEFYRTEDGMDIGNIIHDSAKFIGTPLQLYLMLENCEVIEYFKKWADNTEQEADFNYLGDNMWNVYDKFVKSKYDTYFKKENFKIELRQDQEKKIFDHYHMDLAKTFILKSEPKKDLETFKDIILAPGITRSDGNNIHFIHPTFGEYFAAKVFLRWIRKESNKLSNPRKKEYLLKEILMKSDYEFIRTLMNIKLKEIIEELENNTLKLDLRPFKDSVNTLWRSDLLINSDNKTILHISLDEKNNWIVKFLLNIIDDQIMLILMEKRDNNHRTVLYRAMENLNTFDIVKQLLEKVESNVKNSEEKLFSGEKIILATIFTSKADRKDPKVKSLIDLLNEDDNFIELRKTYKSCKLTSVEKYKNLKTKCDKYEILKQFLHAQNVKEAEEILSTQSDIMKCYLLQSVTKKGNNKLHKAARAPNSELVKFLLENYKKYFDVNARCYKYRTALHKAARAGCSKSVEYLLKNGAKIDIEDDWGNTALRDVLRSGKLDLLQYFSINEDLCGELLREDFKKRTALQDAVVLDRLDIVKWILEKLENGPRELTLLRIQSAKELAVSLQSKQKSNEEQAIFNKKIKADDTTNSGNIDKIIRCLEQKISDYSAA